MEAPKNRKSEKSEYMSGTRRPPASFGLRIKAELEH